MGGVMGTLVMGVGNLLLQDEGAGVRAVAQFAAQYATPDGVELMDGGTSGLELLHQIQGRDCLIILDVVRSGQPAGTVVRLAGEEVPALLRHRISPHQLGLSDLLATLELAGGGPARLVLLGIEPKLVSTGLDLSDEVRRGLDRMVLMLARELGALGLQVTRR